MKFLELINSTFLEKIKEKWKQGKFVCLGLDPVEIEIQRATGKIGIIAVRKFLHEVVSATYDVVCAYKPNLAFYLQFGAPGIHTLEGICSAIHDLSPDVPIILDGKFGDIGKTNEGFVKAAYGRCHADAVTVNPYVGEAALRPFLNQTEKGVIALAKTSNEGSGEFQDLITLNKDPRNKPKDLSAEEWLAILCKDAMPLYERVAQHVSTAWNKNDNCLVVVGATYPAEASSVRGRVGDLPFLIPGIGTQNGDVEKTVIASRDGNAEGMIINSSSSILYKEKGPFFAQGARNEVIKLSAQINFYRRIGQQGNRLKMV